MPAFPKREPEAGSRAEQQQPERSLCQRTRAGWLSHEPGTVSQMFSMFNTILSTSAVLLLTDQIPVLFSNFPRITTRASLLLLHSNVSLITT